MGAVLASELSAGLATRMRLQVRIRLGLGLLPAEALVLGKGLRVLMLAVRTVPVEELALGDLPHGDVVHLVHLNNPLLDTLEVDHYLALSAGPHGLLGSHLCEADHALRPLVLLDLPHLFCLLLDDLLLSLLVSPLVRSQPS